MKPGPKSVPVLFEPDLSPQERQTKVRMEMDFQVAELNYNQALDNLLCHHRPEVWDAYAILSYVNSNRNRWTTSASLNKHFILAFFRKGAGLNWKLSSDPDGFIRLINEYSHLDRKDLPFYFRARKKLFELNRNQMISQFTGKEHKTFDI